MENTLEDVPSHVRRSDGNRVKNKAPAPIQITAEQLLREAWERKESAIAPTPKVQIADLDELLDYQRTERKNFETRIVRNRFHTPIWIRYARWEEEQGDFVRARSIWERAIDNDYRNPVVWINYAEMEMRHRFVNHARNVLDRAVALLPRVDHLWSRYAHMEEMLARNDLVRNVFERWLQWFPANTAYFAYIRFELRHENTKGARAIYERLIVAYPTSQSYLKYAKFEERNGQFGRSRNIFERATEELHESAVTPLLLNAFAKFEERRGQIARARTVLKYALSKFPDADETAEIERAYMLLEKQFGTAASLDSVVVDKQKKSLEAKISSDPWDYDAWFDMVLLMEKWSSKETVRSTYERAVANVPQVATKAYWSRYVYLWLLYAAWAELECDDLGNALQLFKRCVAIVPQGHRKFSFSKLWLQYASAEIRQGNVTAARRVFGTSIGVLPQKHALYEAYIEFECGIGEMERAREIYQVWLTRHPLYGKAFMGLANLELKLGEGERARGVLELAIRIEEVADIEELWIMLGDVVAQLSDAKEAVSKFEKYVILSNNAYVWVGYTEMLTKLEADDKDIREVYKRGLENAIKVAKSKQTQREVAFQIGEKWLNWEQSRNGSTIELQDHIERVRKVIPKRSTNGQSIIFVEEENRGKLSVGNKLLEAALTWKSSAVR